MKGFALGLALKQRRKATRKSPIYRTKTPTIHLARCRGLRARLWRALTSRLDASLSRRGKFLRGVLLFISIAMSHEGKQTFGICTEFLTITRLLRITAYRQLLCTGSSSSSF